MGPWKFLELAAIAICLLVVIVDCVHPAEAGSRRFMQFYKHGLLQFQSGVRSRGASSYAVPRRGGGDWQNGTGATYRSAHAGFGFGGLSGDFPFKRGAGAVGLTSVTRPVSITKHVQPKDSPEGDWISYAENFIGSAPAPTPVVMPGLYKGPPYLESPPNPVGTARQPYKGRKPAFVPAKVPYQERKRGDGND